MKLLEQISFNYLHALRLFFRQAMLQQSVRIYGYGPIVAPRLTTPSPRPDCGRTCPATAGQAPKGRDSAGAE